jgi:signal transduction histidine kinase
MKIWERIILGFISVIIVMIIVDVLAIMNNVQIINQVNDLEHSKRVELTESNRVAYFIQRIKSNLRELFLEMENGERPEEIAYSRRDIDPNIDKLLLALDALQGATEAGYFLSENEEDKDREQGELAMLDSLNTHIPKSVSEIRTILNLLDKNDLTEAENHFEYNLEPLLRRVQDSVAVIVQAAEEEISWAINHLNAKVDKTIRLGIYLTIMSILLSLSIGLYISRSISEPLYKLIHGTKEIEKGNYGTSVDLDTKGELRLLADSFNSMARELKERIDAINKLNRELKESNQTKDKFFSIIAHDLRNPFSVILGFTDLLVEQYYKFNEEEKQEIVKELNKASKTVYDMLENLLTWSRSQSGKVEMFPEKLNLSSIIKESIASYDVNARHKQITLVNDISEFIYVYADKFTITLVINNILNNAIKFTPDGGMITFSAERAQNQVEISIKDTGIGMSQKLIDYLLLSESIGSTPGTRNEKGTGLGLILIKEFVGKNNGSLNIESKPGEGTDFRFSLPVNIG